MSNEIIVLALHLFYLWPSSDAYYNNDAQLKMRERLMTLDRELMYDSMAKRAHLQHTKKYYDKSEIFQIATMIYEIKRKYKRQVFAYYRAVTDLYYVKVVDLLRFVTEIQHIQMEIDNLIQMMEEWEDRKTRQKRITRTGKEIPGKPSIGNSKMFETFRIQQQKQMEYVRRKKLLHRMAKGISRQNLKEQDFKKRNKDEEGFESDKF